MTRNPPSLACVRVASLAFSERVTNNTVLDCLVALSIVGTASQAGITTPVQLVARTFHERSVTVPFPPAVYATVSPMRLEAHTLATVRTT